MTSGKMLIASLLQCKLYWQNQGDFLCVKVDRHTKTKKSIFCNLEIFRVREKDFPVEVVELKDTVTDFSWEPKGERFALVSSNDPNLGNPGPGITIKTDVSFYQHDRSKGDFRLLKTLPGRTSNTVRWSPRGRHVVLATVGSSSKSELEFWDLDFLTDETRRDGAPWGSGIQHLGTADHYALTDAEWDPSGRYLATSASAWRHTVSVYFICALAISCLLRVKRSWRTATRSGTSVDKSSRSTFSTGSSNSSGDHARRHCSRRRSRSRSGATSRSTAGCSRRRTRPRRAT